jgi:hypothetical protein
MKDCTRNDVSVSGGVITVDAACSMPNTMKITVHATILPVGPDAFHSESEMRLDNPPPGVPTMKMVIDARRIGDTCQPGETPLQ